MQVSYNKLSERIIFIFDSDEEQILSKIRSAFEEAGAEKINVGFDSLRDQATLSVSLENAI